MSDEIQSFALPRVLNWVSADVAEKWPRGCKVLVRTFSRQYDTVNYDVDNFFRSDWISGNHREWLDILYARLDLE